MLFLFGHIEKQEQYGNETFLQLKLFFSKLGWYQQTS